MELRNGWSGQIWMAWVLVVAATFVATGCTSTPSIPTLRDEGQRAYIRGEYDASISFWEQLLERKPEDSGANIGIGKAYLAVQENQKARTHFAIVYAQSWQNNDRQFEIAGYLAESLAAQRDLDSLFDLLKQRSELVSEIRDYMRWGDYALQFEDFDVAELAYRMAARLTGGDSADPYLSLATLYETLGRSDAAVIRLRQAYGIDPDNEGIRARLNVYEVVVGPTLALPPDGP